MSYWTRAMRDRYEDDYDPRDDEPQGERPDPESPCPCCGEMACEECRIVDVRVELLSDERGTVYGQGQVCKTHGEEL